MTSAIFLLVFLRFVSSHYNDKKVTNLLRPCHSKVKNYLQKRFYILHSSFGGDWSMQPSRLCVL